ncbi:BMC domain-containing protein [Micropruina sonneratiae]|uniref:BMC domain-containing protein n=1 Tax=Micropruina sonneratiae TaxID=2986940 RepID=UPI002227EE38|nr:BMC domain-containing protein [Micropruina sp. KQZ13P-5]MCW3157267.1 BMC domain-containing protein [Micropruina sp. KQZ13P-5]
MPQLSLGTIEVLGLPAAVAAADVACKTADVSLIGYETTDGMGMVAVKVEGQVSAVQAAVAAARAAAAQITTVFATSVIARPSAQLPPVVYTAETVGYRTPAPEPAEPPAAEAPDDEASPEPADAGEPAAGPSAAPSDPATPPATRRRATTSSRK